MQTNGTAQAPVKAEDPTFNLSLRQKDTFHFPFLLSKVSSTETETGFNVIVDHHIVN